MLFFENYQSVEVKKTPPEFGKLSPEGREFAKVGQTPSFRNQLHKDAYMTMLNSLKLAIEQAGGSPRHW